MTIHKVIYRDLSKIKKEKHAYKDIKYLIFFTLNMIFDIYLRDEKVENVNMKV